MVAGVTPVSFFPAEAIAPDPVSSDTLAGTPVWLEASLEILAKKLVYRVGAGEEAVRAGQIAPARDVYDLAYASRHHPEVFERAAAAMPFNVLEDALVHLHATDPQMIAGEGRELVGVADKSLELGGGTSLSTRSTGISGGDRPVFPADRLRYGTGELIHGLRLRKGPRVLLQPAAGGRSAADPHRRGVLCPLRAPEGRELPPTRRRSEGRGPRGAREHDRWAREAGDGFPRGPREGTGLPPLPLAWYAYPAAREPWPPRGGVEEAQGFLGWLSAKHLAGLRNRPAGSEMERRFRAETLTRLESHHLRHIFLCLRAPDFSRLLVASGLSVYEVARTVHNSGTHRAAIAIWLEAYAIRPDDLGKVPEERWRKLRRAKGEAWARASLRPPWRRG